MRFWRALEEIPGLTALRPAWQSRTSEQFPAFQILCLDTNPQLAEVYGCPHRCGCTHDVILRHDNTGAIAACACSPPSCPDIPLTIEDITPLDVNPEKLSRALAKALACNYKFFNFSPPQTWQFGSWSTASVPVIITIQYKMYPLHSVIAQLALRLRQPYILFSPTNDFIDGDCQELLANASAAFFPLDATVRLNPSGTLQAITAPEQLFAKFTPAPERLPTHTPPKPRYSLRKDCGVWHLTFDGHEAHIKHERGMFYVAWLLHNPPEHPIHALDLIAKIPEFYRQQLGLPSLVDPATGKVAPLQSGARIQERSLALDDAQAMRALYRKEKELEAILDDENESEPVKAEALRELEAIAEFQRQHGRHTRDSAQKAVWAVRNAIKRLHQNLFTALDSNGSPHPVLRPFAAHLKNHLLTPSARYRGLAGTRARGPLAGCFTYDPPPGTTWAETPR